MQQKPLPSLLIIAHGSRRAASNDEVRLLVEQVRAQAAPCHEHVEVAFLELASPSITDALAALAARGVTRVVAFPYFLAAGTHVAADIPAAIARFRQTHPQIEVGLTPHLGASRSLPAAILAMTAAAQALPVLLSSI
jgi:sirohydrochlorin ferrochelatase